MIKKFWLKKQKNKAENEKNQKLNNLIKVEKDLVGQCFKITDEEKIFSIKNLYLNYHNKEVLHDINMDIPKNKIIALIGPSGCGKSSLLRCLNRLNDLIPGSRLKGTVTYHGENIYDSKTDVSNLRASIGMVFQKPNPFPISVYKNVAYGLRIHGITNKETLDHVVTDSLKKAALYEEVQHALKDNATSLSGGQQQRLCIARAIALRPDVILMDEPTSALDPISTLKIEELILDLKKDYTIIIVTHSLTQALRIADYTAFFNKGQLVEYNKTKSLFARPKHEKTLKYISNQAN